MIMTKKNHLKEIQDQNPQYPCKRNTHEQAHQAWTRQVSSGIIHSVTNKIKKGS